MSKRVLFILSEYGYWGEELIGPLEMLEQAGYTNKGTVFTAYNQPLQGLDPIWQLVSPEGQHLLASSRQERRHWLQQGWSNEGVAFYSVAFPNAALTGGWEA